MAKNQKPATKKPTVFSSIMTVVVVILLALAILAPVLTTTLFDDVLREYFGEIGGGEVSSSGDDDDDITANFDTQYNITDYASEDAAKTAQKEYFRTAAAEGYVLLENDGYLPLETSASDKKTVAFFSQSSTDFIIGGTGSGTSSTDVTLKDAFEADGYNVNSDLWNYYSSSGVSRDGGALSYGGAESWGINEVPLSTLQSKVNNFSSISSTADVAVFIMSRTGGEGRDEARWMSSYTNIDEDKSKSYLEPDSVELEIINYLNTNFHHVVIVLNTNNVMEAGWTKNYNNIDAVIWAPGGGDQAAYALADVFCGKTTPSGHLVDTMAYDSFSSPAMQNMGDFQYTYNGSAISYYGVSYDEGIYVGYKYYETRYYDQIMEQGNATTAVKTDIYSSTGTKWDYSNEVQYPFGYGKSYTTFEWSNYTVTDNNDGTLTVSVDVENTGSYSGKDVVELYVSAPYTEWDKTNHIEKAAVSLVGYIKTDTLAPDESATYTTTVSVSDFTSYDDVSNKTYILEAGDYYLTAATDAHEAANNVLAITASATQQQNMTSEGNSSFVYTYKVDETDASTYSVSEATGAAITNQFDGKPEDGGSNYIDRDKYLSRQDWAGTWPTQHGTQGNQNSSYSEVNGKTYLEPISSDLYNKLTLNDGSAAAANNPTDDSKITEAMAGDDFGQDGDLELIQYRGQSYADVDWFTLASQMTSSELKKMLGLAGYTTAAASSINKPKTTDYDGPAGLNSMITGANLSIAFPAEVNVAATWNPETAYMLGYSVGETGLWEGVQGWYGPAMNIHRTPFAGRNFEYYSEDGFMSGTMAAASVKGAAEKGVYAYAKHFALNDQEDHRCDNGIATWCNEQAMREIYLKPFEMVSQAGTVTVNYYEMEDGEYVTDADGNYTFAEAQLPAMQAVMSSFNRVGATWAGGNYGLIQGILRNEWGFNGIVLTDYSQGGYMNCSQELRAGGDAVLLNIGTSSIKTSSSADIYYDKLAASHVLYTVVNSSAMNGYVLGVVNAAAGFANYFFIVIAIDVVCAAGIVLCCVFTARKWKTYKSQAQA
ncbi:MAG: glycoside hydrolase family 3 C-terminal domain-containing protein [Clostridia bacterium]|nr:glycoside hydrolase family 3 C-terminal domain-containing protein [Clostridia bacterium]